VVLAVADGFSMIQTQDEPLSIMYDVNHIFMLINLKVTGAISKSCRILCTGVNLQIKKTGGRYT
jgi:hypothetical protein